MNRTGKPSTTYFCENGHMIENNQENHFGKYDLVPQNKYEPCEICGSNNIFVTCNLWIKGYKWEVPKKPVINKDDYGAPRYNISKIKEREEKIHKAINELMTH